MRAVLTCLALFSACTFASCSEGGLPYEEDEDLAFETEPTSRTPEVADARIEPAPGTELTEGIILVDATAQEGDLVEESFELVTGQRHAAGRRCMLVTGYLRNTTTDTQTVDMWIDGYDFEGQQVASTVVSETQPGHVHLDVPAGAGSEFKVYLDWPYRLFSLQFRVAKEGVPVPSTYAEGQVLEVSIKPALGAFIAEGIRLEGASASVGVLDHSSYNVRTWKSWTRGDWCVVVSGRIHNTTGATRDVDMWVDGFDFEGELVASTLATESQEGYLHLDVPDETSQDFEIIVSWSDEIHTLRVSADIDNRMIPSPPALPPSSIPESLTVFPSAGEYLSTSPNGDHSELLLLAVVAEQVESSRKYHYEISEDRHIILPGDPVLVVEGPYRTATGPTRRSGCMQRVSTRRESGCLTHWTLHTSLVRLRWALNREKSASLCST